MPRAEKHAVLVRVRLSDDDLGTTSDDEVVERIEDAIRRAIDRGPQVGYCDGHEFGGGWAVMFCYGRDATALYERVTEALLLLDTGRTIRVSESRLPDTLDSLVVVYSEHPTKSSH